MSQNSSVCYIFGTFWIVPCSVPALVKDSLRSLVCCDDIGNSHTHSNSHSSLSEWEWGSGRRATQLACVADCSQLISQAVLFYPSPKHKFERIPNFQKLLSCWWQWLVHQVTSAWWILQRSLTTAGAEKTILIRKGRDFIPAKSIQYWRFR